jgi:hypothetical protein
LITARLAPRLILSAEPMTAKAFRALSPKDVLDNVVEAAPAPAFRASPRLRGRDR